MEVFKKYLQFLQVLLISGAVFFVPVVINKILNKNLSVKNCFELSEERFNSDKYKYWLESYKKSCLEIKEQFASQEYQDFALQARQALKIPDYRQIKILKFDRSHKNYDEFRGDTAQAFFLPERIYINEDIIDKRDKFYGLRRFTVFHEMVHAFYIDCYDPETNFNYEFRADIEAAKALKCSLCVKEKIESRREGLASLRPDWTVLQANNYRQSEGKHCCYASIADLEKICLEHEKNNLLCSKHKIDLEKLTSNNFIV